MRLPLEFLNKMKSLLGDSEYEEFLESYKEPRYYGLRVNTLKISVENFLKITPFKLEPIPWTKDGFYYSEGDNPGKHPYYHAGLYYIQEPSAMLPGAIIDAKPGEYILDLCAAPGGKTVQIAAGLKGEGLLVANDINADRVKALVKNIELCGIKNAIVTNEAPERLVQNFRTFFDRILVDAPCSGEGMFRKDQDAARSWENFKCERCAGMQKDILQSVDKMLKPGGCIVYSTCTFAPEEDEIMISNFLNGHGDYELVDIPKVSGIANGRPEWSDGNTELTKMARLWPHKLKGEGHFVAMLKKKADREKPDMKTGSSSDSGKTYDFPKGYLDSFRTFVKESLNIDINGYFDLKGSNLYCLPVTYPDLNGLRVAKFGWYLGEFVRDKFEPSHSMVVSLKSEEVKRTLNLNAGSQDILRYLKGETLLFEGEKGLTGVCVDGYTLGWAKQMEDMLKNLYPKGWRKMA